MIVRRDRYRAARALWVEFLTTTSLSEHDSTSSHPSFSLFAYEQLADDLAGVETARVILSGTTVHELGILERHVLALPLRRDEERLHRLQRSLALYRSVLGQPRQEELVELRSRAS